MTNMQTRFSQLSGLETTFGEIQTTLEGAELSSPTDLPEIRQALREGFERRSALLLTFRDQQSEPNAQAVFEHHSAAFARWAQDLATGKTVHCIQNGTGVTIPASAEENTEKGRLAWTTVLSFPGGRG
jgi:hypothetical protein